MEKNCQSERSVENLDIRLQNTGEQLTAIVMNCDEL